MIEFDISGEEANQWIKDNVRVFKNCYSMTDVAYRIIEDSKILYGASEVLSKYFDYEAYGRDLAREGKFYYLGLGEYVQILI